MWLNYPNQKPNKDGPILLRIVTRNCDCGDDCNDYSVTTTTMKADWILGIIRHRETDDRVTFALKSTIWWKPDYYEHEKDKDTPYLKAEYVTTVHSYNPNYGDDRICECGHPYHRHFDSYEYMEAVGCKYCQCFEFKEK